MISLLTACLVSGYGSKAAAGWTLHAASTSTKAIYNCTTGGASGLYLRVDDTATSNATVYGAETILTIDNVTGQFPQSSGIPSSLQIFKSATTSGDIRPWFLITDGRMFYLGVHGNSDSRIANFAFGDIDSFKVADAYPAIIIGVHSSSYGLGSTSTTYTSFNTHFMARTYSQGGAGISVSKTSNCLNTNVSGETTAVCVYPSQVDNGLLLSPVSIVEGTPLNVVRGILPGIYFTPQGVNNNIANYTQFTGIVGLAGRTVMYTNTGMGSSYWASGGVFFDLTGPWR